MHVYCETGTLSLVHGDTFGLSAAENQFLPLASLDLFVMELSIGDKVFYTMSTQLRVPAKVIALLHNGHAELEYHQDGVQVINHQCPMDSVPLVIPCFESPPPSPLMEAPAEVFFNPPGLESPPPSPSIRAMDVPAEVPPELPLDHPHHPPGGKDNGSPVHGSPPTGPSSHSPSRSHAPSPAPLFDDDVQPGKCASQTSAKARARDKEI